MINVDSQTFKRGQTANQSLTFNFLYQSKISEFFLHPCLGLPWVQVSFFSLLFAAKIERQSRDHHDRCFAAQCSPQTTGKKTLWHLGYFRVRGTDQKIQKCRKARTLAFCSNKRRENATRGISWLTGTFHMFRFNQSAVTTSLAFSHATLNDSLLIL